MRPSQPNKIKQLVVPVVTAETMPLGIGVSCTRAGVEAYAACQQNNGEQLAGLFGQITSRGGMLAQADMAYRGWCHDNRDSGGR